MRDKLKLIPENPGCYLMKDLSGTVIYVGKAKSLKNRVRSYFIGSHNNKTSLLVSEIVDFSYIITNSELEALVLELNLIKQYTPKYNIRLMDDKTYPHILLTKEMHPRLIVVRNNKQKGTLFGPYPDASSARETVHLLNMLYPLRKCQSILKTECLYYHIHQCLAPCINNISLDAYEDYLKKITRFLKGDVNNVITELEDKMSRFSNDLKFEEAKECRDMINSINKTVEKQSISINDKVNRDIITYYQDEEDISIYHICMRNGKIVTTQNEIFSLYEEELDLFSTYLAMYYEKNYKPKELLLPNGTDLALIGSLLDIDCFTPLKGDKKKIMTMAYDNAKKSLEDYRELSRSKMEVKFEALRALESIIKKYPRVIETFDNSNTLGDSAISAMVVFKDGFPSYKDYRKYHLKNLNGSDDYQAMKEVIYRRYYRVLMENLPVPDLIIVDGGKGQLNVCHNVLASLNLNITAIGLKKDSNHKTSSIIYQDQEFILDKHSSLYRFLFFVQEEVHRYAITFHKSTRGKSMLTSKLDGIKGLGPKKKERLWIAFQTIDQIRNASNEMMREIGVSIEVFEEIKKKLG